MNNFWKDNGTKVLGALTAMLGTLASLIAAGAFRELLSPAAIGWLNIFVSLATAGAGGATVVRGFTNTKVAEAAQSQSGFARPLMLAFLLAIAVPAAIVTVPGCATFQQLSFDQQLQFSIDSAAQVTRSVGNALDAGLINKKQAAQYLDLVKNARELFATAIELKDADIETAEGQLHLANDILLHLQRYLNEVQS